MKTLITGGCSFSECISTHIDTWPRHLSRLLPDYHHISTAIGSIGNGLISRRLIAEISRHLANKEKLLVGVIWSGPDRHEIYSSTPLLDKNDDGWMINPVPLRNDMQSNWHIINHHWRNHVAVNYYKNHWDENLHTVYTLEHILRTQWFLKTNHIPYFMSMFTDEVLPRNRINTTETRHLYDLLDFDNFLPVNSELSWCQENQSQFADPVDHHPTTLQHKAFTEQVIMPFLQQKKLIEV